MSDRKIRYVWGDFIGGRQRELYALKGVVRCAIYTAYLVKPEANVITAYPRRLLVRGSLDSFGKISVPVREIYNS